MTLGALAEWLSVLVLACVSLVWSAAEWIALRIPLLTSTPYTTELYFSDNIESIKIEKQTINEKQL